MRKQALILAAAAAIVIGCGGGGHHSSKSTTTTSSTTTTGGMAVNLPNPTVASIDVTYLTGEGRALGDLYLEITRQTIGTTADNVGIVDTTGYRLSLNSTGAGNETLQLPRIDVPFTATTSGFADSRLFSTFQFTPNRLVTQTATSPVAYSQGPTLNGLPATFDARIRAFPGRTVTLQVNVAPSEFPLDDSTADDTTDRIFDQTQFKGLNYSSDATDPDGYNKLSSRLSDFIRFPLSGLAQTDRPDLRTGYGTGDVTTNGAGYVYFSGDNIALSSPTGGSNGIFQEIATQFSDDVDNPVGNSLIGLWSDASSDQFSGTYDLRDILPSSIETDVPKNRLVSINGGFYDYSQVLLGGSTFEIIMFPNSSESYQVIDSGGTASGRQGDIVAIVRSGSTITNMYFGGVDLRAGTFNLFPIKYLGSNPATFSGEIDGTVSGYKTGSGASTTNFSSIRKFGFSFPSGTDLPAGFTSTGTVTVVRP